MTVLLMKLCGPLQAWGERSRFVRRETATEPTKSGVIGLVAAASGRRRTDPIEDLAGLVFGVRVDQPGSLVRDFQTAHSLDGSRVMPLSTRYYLSDAVFLAALQGPPALLEGLADSIRKPTFPLYLGRRSCPPAEPIVAADALREGSVVDVLRAEPWRAASWYRKKHKVLGHARLTLVVDAEAAYDDLWDVRTTARDQPISYDPRDRTYGVRSIARGTVEVTNPDYEADATGNFGVHDPLSELGA